MLTYLRIAWSIRRRPDLLSPATYLFSDVGFERLPPSPMTRPWSEVRSARETDSTFLFYVSRRRVVIVPKRGFASDDDQAALWAVVTAHVRRTSQPQQRTKLRSVGTATTSFFVAVALVAYV